MVSAIEERRHTGDVNMSTTCNQPPATGELGNRPN
jgi:hypothetical protein